MRLKNAIRSHLAVFKMRICKWTGKAQRVLFDCPFVYIVVNQAFLLVIGPSSGRTQTVFFGRPGTLSFGENTRPMESGYRLWEGKENTSFSTAVHSKIQRPVTEFSGRNSSLFSSWHELCGENITIFRFGYAIFYGFFWSILKRNSFFKFFFFILKEEKRTTLPWITLF